jgi:hypothetical protein
MAQPETGIKASSLIQSAWWDLRSDESGDYTRQEMLGYLQRGLRLLANELAARKSTLVSKTVESGSMDWASEIAGGVIALPLDYLSLYDLHVQGRTSLGPLGLISAADRFRITSGSPGWYFLDQGSLHVIPVPSDGAVIYLRYAALPELARVAIPDTDAETAVLLDAHNLPFRGLFDEALRQFVAMSAANRNEYDTRVEQGLFRMLAKTAHDLAGQESLEPLIRQVDYPDVGFDWTGGD